MKKSEMQDHHNAYVALVEHAARAERRGLYREAVAHAKEAWPHIDGWIQFETKYHESKVGRIRAIAIVLKYAPLLLDTPTLDAIDALLASYKRIGKNLAEDFLEEISTVRGRLRENHRLWTYIEKDPGIRQDRLKDVLGGDQTRWKAVAEAWEHMGLVCRFPDMGSYRLSLATRMGQVVPAKCPSCGEVAEGPKAMFLEMTNCPSCGSNVMFVFVSKSLSKGA